MRFELPFAGAGEVVGLFGGSFDPAHDGHAHVTREALKRFGLSRIWWLVSPGNPLKPKGPAPLAQRVAHARRVMQHPRVIITDIEAQLGTRYSAQTICALQRLYPKVRFVWLMGADNLAQLHLWQDWQQIMQRCPIGVLARPETRISARTSPAARVFAQNRLPGHAALSLKDQSPPAWCFLNIPMVQQSSTQIRAEGGWA